MTAQFMETLYLDGIPHYMASEPFNQYLESLDKQPELISLNTACWRGYKGRWEINDSKLYLVALEASVSIKDEIKEVDLQYFFPDRKIVLAEWITGQIRVPMGEMLEYVHMGYESKYEKDLIIQIEKGVVITTMEMENI